MEKVNMPGTRYYCAERTTTFDDIATFAEPVLTTLYNELKTAAIEITGPPEFHYFNVEPTGTKPFTLIIAIPVKEQRDAGEGFFMETELFPCLTADYHGSIDGIGEAWMELVENALEEGYLVQNQCREVYTSWESIDSPKNVISLQVGIASRKC